ncbi:MAG: uridine phosphorylase [Clostridiales bacterium]|nr:uridine phosphorylase [Clostridiales bacterium]
MSDKMYHIGLTKDDVEGITAAILPGDPGRVPLIAAQLSHSKPIAQNREYTSWSGTDTGGKEILVMSTGMGGPSTAIAVEELHMLGIDTVIRVGTCGGMQPEVCAGDLIIVSGAVRQEGTSREYVPVEYPAVADLTVTNALKAAAEALHFRHHVGIVQCKDSFYGQHDPKRMPVGYDLMNKWDAWKKAGVLASEMETAALFVVSGILKMRAGAVMLCVWNQERELMGLGNDEVHDSEASIKTAIEAVTNLI